MKGLCWSRGTPTAVVIQLLNMSLLVVTLLISSPLLTCPLPVIRAAVPAVDLRMELGQLVSFNCSTSLPAHHLVWYDGTLLLNCSQPHHGVTVTLTTVAVTITILNVTAYHYGNYKCFDSRTGQLQKTVALLPSTSTALAPSDLIAEKLIERRDNTVISCSRGDLLVKIDKQFHHSAISNDVLVVTSSDQQGKYVCLEDNNYPSMIYYVQLSGYRPLNITVAPVSVWQVPPYHDVDCLVTGAPGPITIRWYYGNTRGWPIASSGRIHVEQVISSNVNDGGLRLVLSSSFPDYDNGVYICVASNGWEVVEQSLTINFTIGSDVNIYIAYWPTITVAVGGSDINITCYAVSLSELEIGLTFRKDNTLLPQVLGSKLNRYVTGFSLFLDNVTQSDNGVYTCQLLDFVESDLKIGTLVVYKDALHIVSFTFSNSAYGNISLTCSVTVHEHFIHRLADIRVVFEQHNRTIAPTLIFTGKNITISTMVRNTGLYKCIATIDGISKSSTVVIDPSSSSDISQNNSDRLKNILLAGLGVVGFLCLVMCLLLLIICCRCPQKADNTGYSNMVSKTKIGARLSTNSCASAEFVFNKSSSKNSLLSSSEWTIPYDSLQFDCSLGSGAFGTVKKAYMLTGIGQKTPVAVKTLQCGDDEVTCKEAFEKEVMILHRVGSHQHIIGLFGVCMQANRYLLVMELASRGNLLTYLHHKRTDKIEPLSVCEVLSFAKQIALGMEHLANQQCVHCDLAARNVLITGDYVLKISDFGLSRKLYSGVYVKDKSKKVCLPIRWMAPESMTELKFSSQSDIWSYGVVIWEMYQLGAVPYHGVSTHKLCLFLQQGLRLEKPQNCSSQHYQMMFSCWHQDPSSRPSFIEILQELSHLIATTSVVYINWNDDADYYSDCSTSDVSVSSTVEDSCPVHGLLIRSHPAVKRNVPLKRKDSGLPDSPNDPFACKKELNCDTTNCLLEETDL